MNFDDPSKILKELANERALRKIAEKTLEEKKLEFNKKEQDYKNEYDRLKALLDKPNKNHVEQDKFQLIVEKSSDIIFRISRDGYFIYVNPKGCKTIEYSLEELRSFRFDELVSPDYIDEVNTFYANQIEAGIQNTYLEFPIFTKSGRKIWIGQSVDIADTQDEKITELIAFGREITQKKNAEKELQQSEEKYRSIIENMQLGIVEMDKNGTILKAYPSFCKIVGYSCEELEGTKGSFLLNEDGFKRMAIEQNERLTGKTNVYEIELIAKSGERKWVIISGAPIYNDLKEVIGSISIHLDMTERIKMEAELKKTKEIAEDSLRGKELFLANISHEIRTPLNGISGILQLMNGTNLDETQTEYLGHIQNATDNLLILINDLLLLSKAQLGYILLFKEPTSLYTLLSNIFSLFVNNVKPKVDYTANIAIDPENIYLIDKLRLSQIIQNLLSNALKFTTNGRVHLEAKLKHINTELDEVIIRISDTGIGIPKKDLKLVFEKFRQGSNHDVVLHGGTGLGLTIVYDLVKLMNGKITLESGKHGTDISLRFEFERTKKNLKGFKKKIIPDKPIIPMHILVAEDNSVNQFLIKKFLQKSGYSFELVENGKEAVTKINETNFDLVLMDIRMPILDGIRATQIIRESFDINELPIIGLTADDVEKNKQMYVSIGMNHVLSKPIVLEELKSLLKRISPHETREHRLINRLNRLFGSDLELQGTLLKIFIEDSEKRIAAINFAIEKNDSASLASIFHSIKPAIGHLGEKTMYQSLLQIEASLIGGNSNKLLIKKFLDELKDLIIKCREILSKIEK